MPAAVICADSTAAPAADDDTMMRLHMLGFELQRISKWLEWRGCPLKSLEILPGSSKASTIDFFLKSCSIYVCMVLFEKR